MDDKEESTRQLEDIESLEDTPIPLTTNGKIKVLQIRLGMANERYRELKQRLDNMENAVGPSGILTQEERFKVREILKERDDNAQERKQDMRDVKRHLVLLMMGWGALVLTWIWNHVEAIKKLFGAP